MLLCTHQGIEIIWIWRVKNVYQIFAFFFLFFLAPFVIDKNNRIGASVVGFNWYGTERLLRECLILRGIQTYVYYFKRNAKHQQVPLSSQTHSQVRKISFLFFFFVCCFVIA